MTDASSEIEQLHSKLRELRSYFDTITSILRSDIELAMNNIDSMFDIIFDNIFTKITVQTQIVKTLNELEAIESNIIGLISALEERYSFTDEG